MKLRLLGKDSTPTNSPTLYATDHDSYVVQGWIVTDSNILGSVAVGEDDTLVEVPAGLLRYLALDGLGGEVITMVAPLVAVTPGGHYILQGRRVTDVQTLSQMSIPEHETCVQVTKSAMLTLVGG